MSGRRGLGAAVLLCLLGACVILVGTGRAWMSVEVLTGPLTGGREVTVTGTEVAPGVRALGLVGLAGVPALVATRRAGRVVVGGLLVLTGAGVVAAVLGGQQPDALFEKAGAGGGQLSDVVSSTGWPSVTMLGGGLLVVAGLLTLVLGRSWPALGRRYESPAGAAAAATQAGPTPELAERGMWEALDRGEDPTGGGGAPDPETR